MEQTPPQQESQPRKLALIAGAGDLPYLILEAAQDEENTPFVIAFEGQTEEDLVKDIAHVWVRLGEVQKLVDALREQGVTHVVMAGAIQRPSWSEIKLDWLGARWMAKLGLRNMGDDGLLTSVQKILTTEGFTVLGAAEILKNLIAPAGVLGQHSPDEEACADIQRGLEVARALGQVDVGQSVVIQQGLVLGVEAIEGTESLLARSGEYARAGAGGVLVKIAKPGQSRQVDLPTIGPDTILQAHRAGLRGIAVEAGAAQILHRATVVEQANEHGLFLLGLSLTGDKQWKGL